MKGAELRIDKARFWAISREPFYGALALRLDTVIDNTIKTADTDGKVIRWNEKWVSTLTDEEIRFVLLHETLHCAHGHMWRLPADKRGNEAGDHEINLTLTGANGGTIISGIKMPVGGSCDPQYSGMACEEVLRRLPSDEPGDDADGQGSGSGSGAGDPCGSFSPPSTPGQDPAEAGAAAQALQQDWENAVVQAAQAAQAMGKGNLPADLMRQLDRIKAQPIDWRRETSAFVKSAAASRNDWSRSARRHAWQPIIYPRKRIDGLGLVVAIRDTSGSITPQVLGAFNDCIEACMAEHNCPVLVVDCDTRVQAEYRLAPGDSTPATAKGYGGTQFDPAIPNLLDRLDEAGEHIAGVIVLTDLQGSGFVTEHPTLWLCTTELKGPCGHTVPVKL